MTTTSWGKIVFVLSLMVFAYLGGSRIVSVQPHTDSVRVCFPTRHSAPLYPRVQGQWRLPNGNMLLVDRDAGRVTEVGPDGRPVWNWVHGPHGKSKVPVVTGAHRYDLTRKEVASWPCSSADSLRASPSSSWGPLEPATTTISDVGSRNGSFQLTSGNPAERDDWRPNSRTSLTELHSRSLRMRGKR